MRLKFNYQVSIQLKVICTYFSKEEEMEQLHLIEKAQNGDEEAFTKLIVSIQMTLYRVAKTKLSCDDDINEAVQETMIQTFKSIRKLKQPEFFKTWVIKILINNCKKIYKKNKKIEEISYDDDVLDNMYYKIDDYNDIDFFYVIKNLDYNERITLTLYYAEKFTTKEISKILNQPESTIKNRISRARKKLKKIIEGRMYNGEF